MIKKALGITTLAIATVMMPSCNTEKKAADAGKPLSLIVVDPGHFHAGLVQKSMYDDVNALVHVYAPEGPDVQSYLDKVEKYNTRAENPTKWEEKVYKGTDFLEKMLAEKAGNVVVLAGNNQKKTDYIKKSVDAGLHVLADKPMAIDDAGFTLLKNAFTSAEKNNVLLYDIMTERYEITNILQKELAALPAVFGELEKGTPENPAVSKESVHHFFKYISGEPIVRPTWFFDVKQQGEGIVDVTTHLVDLIQWASFPGVSLDYEKDVRLTSAKRFATQLTPSQFKLVTKSETYPDFLTKDVKDSTLSVYSNGEINYALKGVHAKVSVIWNFQAPEGTGDTHYSIMRGTKANLIIRQGKDQNYKPKLYLEPIAASKEWDQALEAAIKELAKTHAGISFEKNSKGYQVTIPDTYEVGHEAHFAQVANKYMEYLKAGKLPEWEVPNMITKYYITTQALKKAMETPVK